MVRRLGVVGTMRVIVSSLIFVFFVSVLNVVYGRRSSLSTIGSVGVVGRCGLVLIGILDGTNACVGANCSLLI